MESALSLACLVMMVSAPLGAEAAPMRGSAVDKSGQLAVSFVVRDGFRIELTAKVKGKVAYSSRMEMDVTSIGVAFADLDGDGREDVIVTYGDEGGYTIEALVRHGDGVVEAMRRIKDYIRSFTGTDVGPGGEPIQLGGHALVHVPGEIAPRLVVRNVALGKECFTEISLKIDAKEGAYAVATRGKKIKIQGASQDL